MTEPQTLGRFAFVDHLRGMAALAVAVFHAFGSTFDTAMWAPLLPFAACAELGWQGVHVFFVLSGFCIAEKIASLVRSGRGPRAFMRDRFWRIMPAYWATLLVCLLLGLAAVPFNGKSPASALPPSMWAWFLDFGLVQHWFEVPSLLLVSWTLAYEAAFYLIAALFLAFRPAVGEWGVITAGCVLTVFCFLIRSCEIETPLRFWPEFWTGFLAHAFLLRRKVWLGIAVVLTLAFVTLLIPANPIGQLHLVSVLTAIVLLAAYRHDQDLIRWPAWQWLGQIGVWSYSLYLVHAPLLSRSLNLGRRYVPPDSPLYALLLLGALALTLYCAWIFSRLVEGPIERWRHRPKLQVECQIA
ncbi:acyltransferase 3 [Opitutus terrae PB90-1]|uniref:Acyltransferase 3 n=2 Tax=Opitutus terrae TaxID=107709 RepID=B1ZW29_OPITP|nr:acyltransferase 3 [Opitutus terrae PB90-1]